jgi:hypothetical protein
MITWIFSKLLTALFRFRSIFWYLIISFRKQNLGFCYEQNDAKFCFCSASVGYEVKRASHPALVLFVAARRAFLASPLVVVVVGYC